MKYDMKFNKFLIIISNFKESKSVSMDFEC